MPTTWLVTYQQEGCGSQIPGMLVVDPPSGFPVCGDQSYRPKTIVTLGAWHVRSVKGLPHHAINGINVYQLPVTAGRTQAWDVPSLNAVVVEKGPGSSQVLGTLTTSPRAAVLSAGPTTTPNGWHQQRLGPLTFFTPAGWPTQNAQQGTACKSYVALGDRMVASFSPRHQIIEPERAAVVLDSDEKGYDGSCAAGQFYEVAPGAGVEVNANDVYFPDKNFRSDQRIHLHNATVYVSDSDPYDILNIDVLISGRAAPIDMQIGLSGTGSTARSILYSISGA